MTPRNTLILVFLVMACSADKAGDSTSVSPTVTNTLTNTATSPTPTSPITSEEDCSGEAYSDAWLCKSWLVNVTGETSAVMRDEAGGPHLVNVLSVTVTSDGGSDYARVQATGIPSYSRTLTAEDVAALHDRANASTDFVTGETVVAEGDRIEFGQDVGYFSDPDCVEGEGYGYWPPGPTCPSNTDVAAHFPLVQEPSAKDCATGGGTIGLWLNGVAVFNWGDTFSWDNAGVWENVAPLLEIFDMGICDGHAAGDTYHHHSYPSCLADQLGDDDSGHSPIFGFAADGYPIAGPWFAAAEAAQSCWVQRDYDDPDDPTGCGGTGQRRCLMIDQLQPDLGTETTASPGPSTSEQVTSLSGNVFDASEGLYYQDYYFDADCEAEGGASLDSHNGHEHDDWGYHYHITSTFPFIVGPTFYGRIHDNAITGCGGGEHEPPPPGSSAGPR